MIPEHISQMEPMLPSEAEPELSDRAFDLVQQSSALAAPLSMPVQEELGRLVRSMNCYYSNFIEGHQTQPRDIERALARDFDCNERQRVQQLLSAAAGHHRLLWIHPFVDGNGRVARLMSHALLLRLGVGSSLWSVSR